MKTRRLVVGGIAGFLVLLVCVLLSLGEPDEEGFVDGAERWDWGE